MKAILLNLAQLAIALLFGLFTLFNLVRELADRRDIFCIAIFGAMTYAAYKFIIISTKELKSARKG